jgi:hypothetical protein
MRRDEGGGRVRCEAVTKDIYMGSGEGTGWPVIYDEIHEIEGCHAANTG